MDDFHLRLKNRIQSLLQKYDVQLTSKFGRRWVKALRSGEYNQTVGVMYRKAPATADAFCCLGVACDLVEGEVGAWGEAGSSSEVSFEAFESIGGASPSFPDDTTIQHFFRGEDASLAGEEIFLTLASLNDNGYSFREIADVIEQTLLEPQEGGES